MFHYFHMFHHVGLKQGAHGRGLVVVNWTCQIVICNNSIRIWLWLIALVPLLFVTFMPVYYYICNGVSITTAFLHSCATTSLVSLFRLEAAERLFHLVTGDGQWT